MNKIRVFIAGLLATIAALAGVFALATPAQALFEGAKDQACNGANLTDDGGCDTSTDSDSSISKTVKAIINILSFVVGIVAIIMLIIGGIRFITSQGEGSSTAAARSTIIYALVGILVVVMAQVLVKFVIGRVNAPAPVSNVAPSTDDSKIGPGPH